jgi:hypothetical protein
MNDDLIFLTQVRGDFKLMNYETPSNSIEILIELMELDNSVFEKNIMFVFYDLGIEAQGISECAWEVNESLGFIPWDFIENELIGELADDLGMNSDYILSLGVK